MKFPERLKSLRTLKGVSRQELADHLGMSYETIGKWEHGTRDPGTDDLIKMALFLGVSTDYLLGVASEQIDAAVRIAHSPNTAEALEIKEMWTNAGYSKDEIREIIKLANAFNKK